MRYACVQISHSLSFSLRRHSCAACPADGFSQACVIKIKCFYRKKEPEKQAQSSTLKKGSFLISIKHLNFRAKRKPVLNFEYLNNWFVNFPPKSSFQIEFPAKNRFWIFNSEKKAQNVKAGGPKSSIIMSWIKYDMWVIECWFYFPSCCHQSSEKAGCK